MNLGPVGRGVQNPQRPGEIMKPVMDTVQKAAKAGKIQKIKLKVKMK